MTDRALTVKEVCERYGVEQHTILSWIHSGELRAINCGRRPGARKPRWRISAEALAAFELRRTHNPPPPPVRRRNRKADTSINYY